MKSIAILGAGNIGSSIARGLVKSGGYAADRITATRRNEDRLSRLEKLGMRTGSDNVEAVRQSEGIIVAVDPQHLNGLLDEIASHLDAKRHLLISVVSGASIGDIRNRIGNDVPVIRAMPNTAIMLGESMTCLSADAGSKEALTAARAIFDVLGKTLVIDEELMTPATALCACGIAFFLRAIRAASQGGIEIGFHSREAIEMAAQTAKGAASLLLSMEKHPEREIDKVTTPRGCTIAGLNEMEHKGFSSALIKGIVTSATKAQDLYVHDAKSRD